MFEPQTEQELAEIIRNTQAPLNIQGGGTRSHAATGDLLSTKALSGIKLYEPGALTMVAGAGTPIYEIEKALAAEGQMLAFEPYDLAAVTGAKGASTIGGVFATNASGSRRVQVGAARDFLLGVRFVDGAGNIIKNGGRVMKNVTGYDLTKLMAGSRGRLGVITEVAFKTLPKPETQATLIIHGLNLQSAVKAMADALSSPYDVAGAAHGAIRKNQVAVTTIRIEGFEDSVKYRANALKSKLSGCGDIACELDASKASAIWSDLRGLKSMGGAEALWQVGLKASEAPSMLENGIWQTLACDAVLDWGGSRVWICADQDQLAKNAEYASDPTLRKDPKEGAAQLHAALQEYSSIIGARANLAHATTNCDVPHVQPEPAPIARLTAGLRGKFDPRRILNRGMTDV